jgi:hypothetical protein
MSWDELENIGEQAESETAALPTRDKQIISAVFNTPDGQEALKILYGWTIGKPNMPAPDACSDGAMLAQLMCVREGENNLFRRIRACVAEPVTESIVTETKT